jgi:predicted nucleic-acid-binding protein
MIGLDSSVLIRYLTRDDPKQAESAQRLINSFTEVEPGFISLVALVETLWVLRRHYKHERATINQLVDRLLGYNDIVIQESEALEWALSLAEMGGGDIPDLLISILGINMGCTHTATFDRRAAAIPGMELLEA